MAAANLESFLAVCRTYDGGKPSETLRQASREFMAVAKADPSVRGAAAASMSQLPAAGAALLAVLLGALVEGGSEAGQTAPALLGLFFSWLPKLPPLEEGGGSPGADGPNFTPEPQGLLNAFDQLCQALVSHLARAPEQRREVARDASLLNRLEELETFSNGARWVREMLLRHSGSLVVLHPPSGTGLRVKYENVATCFHLFSLLQVALGRRLPGGRDPDPEVADAALGKSQRPVRDRAWWHYGDPRSVTASLNTMVWGEGLVRDLPLTNGLPVLLLWPPLLQSRGWDAGFFGPHLDAMPAGAAVEAELTEGECRGWFEALGLPQTGARRKWWSLGWRDRHQGNSSPA